MSKKKTQLKKEESVVVGAVVATPPPSKYQFDSYLDMFTLREKPISEAAIERLALEMLKWADEDPEAYKLSQFYVKKGIRESDINRLSERYPNLKEAKEWALVIIGNRRELGGIKKLLDSGMISRSMSHYDPVWKKIAEFNAELARRVKEGEEKSGPQFIIMERFDESPIVPQKATEDRRLM